MSVPSFFLSPWPGCHAGLSASHQLLLTSTEAGAHFHVPPGHPVLPPPAPLAPGQRSELLVGKPGGAPCFWECHSSGGGPGFPVQGPVSGQSRPTEGGGGVTCWNGPLAVDEHSENSVEEGQMDE